MAPIPPDGGGGSIDVTPDDVNVVDMATYVGDTISRVSRIRHQVGDDVVSGSDEGPVEIKFGHGTTLYGESGADGETIRVKDTPWVDPFAGPLSPENEEFVRTSGKWIKQDVSDEQPFAKLIDRRVADIAPIAGITGKQYGLVLNVSGYLLALYVNGDELYVSLLP
jgi:hypothetical protein